MIGIKKNKGLTAIQVAGLDIGSGSVKAVQLQKEERGYVATHAAIVPITASDPEAGPSDADIRKAVEACCKQACPSRYTVCGLSGTEVMVRGFNFPNLPPEALAQAVLFEAQQVCPLDIKNSVVDYQLITPVSQGENSDAPTTGLRGFFVVGTNEAVQRKKTWAQSVASRAVLMDVDGLALLNCISRFEQRVPGTSIAVINVGKMYTNIAILGEDGLPFIRDLPEGSQTIIERIAAEYNVSFSLAEQALSDAALAREHGIETGPSLRKACRNLVGNISDTIRYYTLQEESAPNSRVLLCGGFALLGDFVAFLDESLPEEVAVFNPFAEIPWVGDSEGLQCAQKYGPALAVATGLAMRTV
ncbi:MAG: pilus assembly protein PilM [Sedimentisphaerales bacterium]|nr:pilus assembly protein PilM [Sedimentisphaerales bacterium]